MTLKFLDRDSSWMDFNRRVLDCARDTRIPLLERINFLSITSANLDEFFQVRMSGSLDEDSPTHTTKVKRDELIDSLLETTHSFAQEQYKVYRSLIKELNKHSITLSSIDDLDSETLMWLSEYFDEHVYPVLTPLAVDPAHPFPWISSLSINLAFILREPKTSMQRFARVKIPTNLDRLIQIPQTTIFLKIEDVIQNFWERLFPGMDLESHFTFRVTRSSQYKLDEGDDILEAMSTIVRRHQRFGHAVRLEIENGIDETWVNLLQNEITLNSDRIFHVDGMLNYSNLRQIAMLNIDSLRYPKWTPTIPSRLNKQPAKRTDLFSTIRERDFLIHRPYESYEETVEALVHQASRDPQVLAIKMTLYRAANVNSPIVQALCRAAEAGKAVVALVELKARFDEQANIERAKKLERSGVHVVYGKVGLKTHGKLLHIVRVEGDNLQYYSHVSTGNYNPSTAGLYEDFDFFTADQRIGRDIGDLFNNLTGYSNKENYRDLVVAPSNMREQLLELIEEQSRPGGYIIMKCNNIVDAEILAALCEAESAGAHINIIVRASCGFTPEILDKHPHINVRSILGRFLEHSRVYRFGVDEQSKLLIGSADLMIRNLDHRVEVLVSIHTEHIRRYINEALDELIDDDNDHWKLKQNGWVHIKRSHNAHNALMEIALYRADTIRKFDDSQRNIPEQLMDEDNSQ